MFELAVAVIAFGSAMLGSIFGQHIQVELLKYRGLVLRQRKAKQPRQLKSVMFGHDTRQSASS